VSGVPSTYVKKFSEGEKYWNKAKQKADEEGKGDNYAYITSIFKKMVGAAADKPLPTIYQRVIAKLSKK
jgi:hypothetical protein